MRPRIRKRGVIVMQKSPKKVSLRFHKKRKYKKRVLALLLGILGFAFIVAVVGTIWLLGYLGYVNSRLPDPGKFVSVSPELATKIYDRDWNLLYVLYKDEYREFVPLEEIPDHVKWAVMSAEDIEFYYHKGVDFVAIAKSILRRLTGRTYRITGASTITQQLVRNVILERVWGRKKAYERTITRKLVEIIVSLQLEKKLSKDEILELYLNEVPLGGVNYGIRAAAKSYFNKEPKDLTLAEAAFLAGIIHRPSYYITQVKSGNVEVALKRRNQVLDLMYKYRDLTGVTKEQIEAAKREPLVLKPAQLDIKAPHFVFYVISQLEEMYGADTLRTAGLQVRTTLDMEIYQLAEEEVKTKMSKFCDWYGACNAALVIINPKNGEVLTMIGSVDYNKTDDPRIDGNVNVAVSLRQMGSTAKPYAYLAAFEKGYFPGTPAPDVPFKFYRYNVQNWDKGYKGIMVMAEALNASRNVPAVYTLQLAGGAQAYVNIARRLGITTLTDPDRYGLSIAIGSAEMKLLEHTNGYAVFAAEGIYHKPTVILEVKDKDGKVIYKYDPKKNSKRVVDRKYIYMINWILCRIDGNHRGLSNWAYYIPGQKLCGKTGTTNGPKDLVAILYYPRLVIGVWAGNNNGKKTYGRRGQGWGANVPLPIANDLMKKLVPKFGYEFFKTPPGIKRVTVCKDTGYIPASDEVPCEKKLVVAPASLKIPTDNAHIKVPICKPTGKIATNADEARAFGLIEDQWFFDYSLPIPQHTATYLTYLKEKVGYKLWQERPAEEPCDLTLLPQINIVSPTDGYTVPVESNITISGSVSYAKAITSIRLYINDTLIKEFANTKNFNYVYTLPASFLPGTYTITVEAVGEDGLSNRQGVEIVVSPAITPTPTPTVTPTITPTLTPTPTPTITP